MRFTRFEVRPGININYTDPMQILHMGVHPDQDMSLLEQHADEESTPDGCELVIVDGKGQALLLAEDGEWPEGASACCGSFGGLTYMVMGISDEGEWLLQHGNCHSTIQSVCAALNALLPAA